MINREKAKSDEVIILNLTPYILPATILIALIVVVFSALMGVRMISMSIDDLSVNIAKASSQNESIDYKALEQNNPDPKIGNIDDDAALGNRNANVAIIEFSDYNCGFCARFHTNGTFDQIVSTYVDTNQLYYVYRDFPGVGGETTEQVASAAECIRRDINGSDQDFFSFIKMKYSNQSINDFESLSSYVSDLGLDANKFMECANTLKYLDEVNIDRDAGIALGITGTPTFLIGKLDEYGNVEGEIVVGAQNFETFAEVIEKYL